MLIEKAFFLEGHRVQIKRNSRSRSLKLRMDPMRKIPILTAPPHCKSAIIEKFLNNSREWWISQYEKVDSPALITHVSILGHGYRIVQKPALKRVEIDHETREIVISKPVTDVKALIQKELIKIARGLFDQYTKNYAHKLNATYADITLRDYRARWGTCKHDKRIVYSWRLVMAPLAVLKYVCAHEVAHLLHFNHSPEFWAAVRYLMPDYKVHKNWLKMNGQTLFRAF